MVSYNPANGCWSTIDNPLASLGFVSGGSSNTQERSASPVERKNVRQGKGNVVILT